MRPINRLAVLCPFDDCITLFTTLYTACLFVAGKRNFDNVKGIYKRRRFCLVFEGSYVVINDKILIHPQSLKGCWSGERKKLSLSCSCTSASSSSSYPTSGPYLYKTIKHTLHYFQRLNISNSSKMENRQSKLLYIIYV